MRALFTVVFFSLLAACGGREPIPDQATVEATKLCGRAYGSTVDSIQEQFTHAGADMPEMPPKEAYVELCVSQGFTPEQARCLDPKLAVGDPEGCAEALAEVLEQKEALGKLFADALHPPDAAEGEATEGEATEGEATEGEAEPAEPTE